MRRARRHSDQKVIDICSWEHPPGARGIVLYDEAGLATRIDDWRDIAVAYPTRNGAESEFRPEFWLPGIDWAVETHEAKLMERGATLPAPRPPSPRTAPTGYAALARAERNFAGLDDSGG